MAHSYTSFAPITLDAPFIDATASNRTSVTGETRISTVAASPSPSMREAPTQPVVEGDSWSTVDDPCSGVFGKNPEWCVDLGDEMIALHAVDLYTRLATGQIPSEAPVWRVGREAWTPARDVPELRYAVGDGSLRETGDRPSVDDAIAFAQTG